MDKVRPRILIIHTGFEGPGGVSQYFRKIRGHFTLPVDHFIVGIRSSGRGRIQLLQRIISDYTGFRKRLRNGNYEIIHVNPSLEPKSFLREGIFHFLSILHGKKTVVFFRAWRKSFESQITRHFKWLFLFLYGKAGVFVVLSEEFRDVLLSWGCNQSIHKEYTVVEDAALLRFDIGTAIRERLEGNPCVLFLSRVVAEKGIFETIKAVAILQARFPDLHLVVAGEGSALEGARRLVQQISTRNVSFAGYVWDDAKNDLLRRSTLLCLPTRFDEGLPNAIAEAMSFGLPVVTCAVGGIKDFFCDGRHGFITRSDDPVMLASRIDRLLSDRNLYADISANNHGYAKERFLASDAAGRLELIYKTLAIDSHQGDLP